jgi:dCTP deaminase
MLLHNDIINKRGSGDIWIEPFDEKNVGPNSYDVRLGNELVIYDLDACEDGILDVTKENPTKTLNIGEEGIVLQPNILYLGHTIEEAGSKKYIPMYEGRSSMARLGIQSHISAGFGDLGFQSQWTLELSVVHPVLVKAGMRIGQIYFVEPGGLVDTNKGELLKIFPQYEGKYGNQTGAQSSMSYKDFSSL